MNLSKQQLRMLHDFAIYEIRTSLPDKHSTDTHVAECWVKALERVFAKDNKTILIKDKEKSDE